MQAQIENIECIVYSSVLAVLRDELHRVKKIIEEAELGPAAFAYQSGMAAELENLIKIFEKRRKENDH